MSIASARKLRARMTRQEAKLWVHLRALRSLGWHFRRQVPIGRYVVDFACLKQRLIVEVDGGHHNHEQTAAADRDRDAFLRDQGFRIARFWNSDVDQNVVGTIESIVAMCELSPPGSACGRTTLPCGEGESGPQRGACAEEA